MAKKIKKVETTEEIKTAVIIGSIDEELDGSQEDADESVLDTAASILDADEDEEDDELIDEPEMTGIPTAAAVETEIKDNAAKKLSAKAQKYEAQKANWLKNAKLTDEGKYIIVVEVDYKGYAEHPTWRPVFYVVNTDLTLTRIGIKLTYELSANAVEMTKEELKELKSKKGTEKSSSATEITDEQARDAHAKAAALQEEIETMAADAIEKAEEKQAKS